MKKQQANVNKEVVQENKLAELLQTEDVLEQEKRVRELIKLAKAPFLHIGIIVDTRTGAITVSGTPLPYDTLYRILDETRISIAENERRDLLKRDREESKPE